MIEVRDLEKKFGDVHAVNGVSFTAKSGAITGLLGPNGAGKTTTIRMIGTLVTIDGGSVSVNGIDATTDAEAVRRTSGLLTDARGLYTRLTARENIRYYADMRSIDRAKSDRTIARFADWPGRSGALPHAPRGAPDATHGSPAVPRNELTRSSVFLRRSSVVLSRSSASPVRSTALLGRSSRCRQDGASSERTRGTWRASRLACYCRR